MTCRRYNDLSMNIAFTHAGFPGGGAERVTKDIANYLSKFGNKYKVYVFTKHIATDLLTTDHTVNIKLEKTHNHSTEEIIGLIEKHHIDILVQSSFPLKGIRKIKKRTGVKVIFTSHEEPFWKRYTKQRGFFQKLIYSLTPKSQRDSFRYRQAVRWTQSAYNSADIFTVLCDEYKEIIRKELNLGDCHHIVSIENPEYLVENINYNKEKIILYSGRLDQMSKQLDKLLRIWQRIQCRLPDWKLIISGDGQDKTLLHNEAERLKLERCDFIGQQNDMRQWYDKASIVCLTSRTEGWPLCMTEAQAHGCIGIAFGCTAGVENILSSDGDKVCGFIVPPYDEDKYAETLIYITELPQIEQESIRRNAVLKRSRYVPETIAEKWRLLFESL